MKEKQRKRSVLCVVGLVWVMLVLLTGATAATNTVYFDPDPSSTAPGNTTAVTLWLDASDGVASFNTWVHFNLSVVNITSGTAGDFPYSFGVVHFGNYVKIAGTSSDGLDQTGHLKLADLTVKAISPGTSALWYTNNVLYNQTSASVSATWINGTFICACFGTCCNDSSCTQTYQTNMTCKDCTNLSKYWQPNKDSACFGGNSTSDLCLDYCPHCTDSVDNDYDGSIDYPSDGGCTCGLDPSEEDPMAPIPEASSFILLSFGLCALVLMVRLQRRK
jgi:hypothetical protein